MKKKILLIIATMFIFTGGVKALEGEYEQEYTVDAINQYDQDKNSETLYHLMEKNLQNCNEDFTICDVPNPSLTVD